MQYNNEESPFYWKDYWKDTCVKSCKREGKLRPTYIIPVAVILSEVDLKSGNQNKYPLIFTMEKHLVIILAAITNVYRVLKNHLFFGGPVLKGMSINVTEDITGNNRVSAGSTHIEWSPPPQSSLHVDKL